jgi:acetyl-CoA carboxylase biotin carboxyl carrier protein
MSEEGNAPDLLTLIDRLEELLNASELSELELEVGDTALVLRKSVALAQAASVGAPASPAVADAGAAAAQEVAPAVRAVVAPLTGLFYTAPSPGAEPYVREGGQVAVGQVIGLIEAMKLFNEIKSDIAGRVVRLCVESGGLVKARQPLLEVEP